MNMNKVLLVLIITSGFLLIIYANTDLFSRKNLLAVLQKSYKAHGHGHDHGGEHRFNDFDDILDYNIKGDGEQNDDAGRGGGVAGGVSHKLAANYVTKVKYIPKINKTEYNVFIIYTKENSVLRNKFELFLKSLLKHSSVALHLHIISDEKSELSAEEVIKTQIIHYRKVVFYTMYDVNDCAMKISDIVHSMMPLFSYSAGSYYSDALFLLSLGLHRIVDVNMRTAIIIDCDVVFRSDVKELFNQFHRFSPDNLFGLAPELTPVYRHILYQYRAKNPHTLFGSPYYLGPSKTKNTISKKHSNKHGYPGLNSGIVMLNLEKIRSSRLYEENLKQNNVKNLVEKYSFKGHLGDQDFYTLLGYEFPGLIYRLDCIWNRQLCTWWKEHGYSNIFDTYFHCEGKIRIYHGNCNTRIPE